MVTCRYCDNIKYDKVCDKCLDKMIYEFVAIQKYGLTKIQLTGLFSIKSGNNFSELYDKYHENDLYNLQNKIIKNMTVFDKQYKILIRLQKKIDVENLLIDLFKKSDVEYIQLYEKITSKFVSDLCKIDMYCSSYIAFKTYELIEGFITNRKKLENNI
jgi:hypothetical protein